MRQMHDLGSFAVRGTAPLLARVLKAGGDSYETGLNDVRTYGLKRPAEADDVPIANVIRCLAWLALMLAALALYIVASFARVGWLTIPNTVDILPALLFTACFAPPVFP
jgi:hypothetical protein